MWSVKCNVLCSTFNLNYYVYNCIQSLTCSVPRLTNILKQRFRIKNVKMNLCVDPAMLATVPVMDTSLVSWETRYIHTNAFSEIIWDISAPTKLVKKKLKNVSTVGPLFPRKINVFFFGRGGYIFPKLESVKKLTW